MEDVIRNFISASNVNVLLNALTLGFIGAGARTLSKIHGDLKALNGRLIVMEEWRKNQEVLCRERLHACERTTTGGNSRFLQVEGEIAALSRRVRDTEMRGDPHHDSSP